MARCKRKLFSSLVVICSAAAGSGLVGVPRIALANWPSAGLPVCTTPAGQDSYHIISNDAGGFFAVWSDTRGGFNSDIYAQRVGPSGDALWAPNGVLIAGGPANQAWPQVVSDGAGGIIVVWQDYRSGNYDIYAQRVHGNGTAAWSVNGVSVCVHTGTQDFPVIAMDDAGGAIIAWNDHRDFSDLFAQRIAADGAKMWPVDGVVLCDAYNAQVGCQVVSDGVGGAIFAWGDNRLLSGTTDMWAQRIDGLGNALWAPNGNLVSGAPGQQGFPLIASDGNSGVIVAWDDWRVPAADAYAQRMNADGTGAWLTDGTAESAAAGNQYPRGVVGDGFGGAVTVWEDGRSLTPNYDIYAQLTDANGASTWGADGTPICTASGKQSMPGVVSDGSGGFIIAWSDARGTYANIFAQRVTGNGAPLWTLNGVAIAPAASAQAGPQMVSDGSGGAYVLWRDETGGYGLVAQRVGSLGLIPSGVGPDRVPSGMTLSPGVPNPTGGPVSFDVTLSAQSEARLAVYDVAGRLIATRSLGATNGTLNRFTFDGRDDSGAMLPSGVYFCRITAGNASQVRKFVVQR